jgi:5-methylthioribose kinase
MREVSAETAADYLRATGHLEADRAVKVEALGWGVSNVVLRVEPEGQAPIVLKQSREQLRTRARWVSRLDRIWAETSALRLLATILPAGTVPVVQFEEPDDYLFAMSCAPAESVVWKEPLLAGHCDPDVARRAGAILGTIHETTIDHAALAGILADRTVFDELRIDPFYRTVARAHPDLAPRLVDLAASMETPPARTFVHGDFSPKNILVHRSGLTLVDFETAHAGDPAFDLGFFLSHLLLKAFRAAPADEPVRALIDAFWAAYRDRHATDRRRAIPHASACALARVDGKSPVDYLGESARDAVRRFARAALFEAPSDWDDLMSLAAREMHGIPSRSGG